MKSPGKDQIRSGRVPKDPRPSIDYLALYRPIDHFDLGWGVKVSDAGFTNIKPGVPYPPPHHPADFLFTWEKGRRLLNHQIVFIGKGGGVLETEHGGVCRLAAGDVFFLHADVWHRYRPYDKTGWTERWCGLCGHYVEKIVESFFPVDRPVIRGADAANVRSRLRTIARLFRSGRTADVPALVAASVGLLTDLAPFVSGEKRTASRKLAPACDEMLQRFAEEIDLEDLAKRHGMGYTLFRRAFKERTGYTPHAYIVEIRLNRAKSLLRDTPMSVEEIATTVGFSSLSYFSQVFRSRFGMSARAWRAKS